MDANDPELHVLIQHLRRYARALVGNGDEIDDLIQESLARAVARMRSNGALGNIRNRKAYLFAILHNTYMDRLTERYRAGNVIPLHEVSHFLSIGPNQHHSAVLNDLEKALLALPVEYRHVVLLVGLEGFTYREAASILDIPIGTVMSRLSRGRERLRQLMDPADTDADMKDADMRTVSQAQ